MDLDLAYKVLQGSVILGEDAQREICFDLAREMDEQYDLGLMDDMRSLLIGMNAAEKLEDARAALFVELDNLTYTGGASDPVPTPSPVPTPLDFRRVDSSEAIDIIREREPRGLFYVVDEGCVTAIDNSAGDAWTEEFHSKPAAIRWLLAHGDAKTERGF